MKTEQYRGKYILLLLKQDGVKMKRTRKHKRKRTKETTKEKSSECRLKNIRLKPEEHCTTFPKSQTPEMGTDRELEI